MSLTSSKAKLLRSIVVQFCLLGAFAVFNVVVARSLGPAARGDYAVASTIATLAATMGGLGAPESATRLIAQNGGLNAVRLLLQRDSGTLVVSAVGAALVLLALGYGVLGAFAAILATLTLFLIRLQIAVAMGSGGGVRFDLLRLLQSGAPLMAAAIVIPLGVTDGVVLLVASSFITAAGCGRFIARIAAGRGPAEAGLSLPSRGSGILAAILGLLLTAVARVDVVLVAAFADEGAAGVYSLALAAGEIPLAFATMYGIYLMPRSARNPSLPVGRACAITGTISALTGLAVYGLLHQYAVDLLGPDFEEVSESFLLLLPGLLAFGCLRILIGRSMGRGVQSREVGAVAAGLAFLAAADFLLVPRWGVQGAALGSSAAYALTLAAYAWATRARRDSRIADESIIR